MSETTLTGIITVSSGTAAQWAATTKIVPVGVLLYESDTKKFKVADGSSLYSALPYVIAALGSMNIGNGLQNDGSGNLTLKVLDNSITVASGGISVNTVTMINPIVAHGNVTSGTLNLNRATAAAHSATIGGAIAITLSNFASGTYSDIILELTNGGAFTITWPTINWITGTGVTTTSFATYGVALQTAGVDWVTIFSPDGVNYFGKVIR